MYIMNFACMIKVFDQLNMKNNNLQQKNIKPPHKIEPNLSSDYQKAFKRGIEKKYSKKDRSWVERIQNNLRIGLAQKYPAK